jgi:hypothetical protein
MDLLFSRTTNSYNTRDVLVADFSESNLVVHVRLGLMCLSITSVMNVENFHSQCRWKLMEAFNQLILHLRIALNLPCQQCALLNSHDS